MTRVALTLTTVLALLAPLEARADFHLRSPYEIDQGELEIEHNGAASFDRNPEISGAQSYTLEFGTGLTSWWHSEIEFGFDRDPGFNEPTLADSVVTENMFQLAEPGKYLITPGFYVEYGQSLTTGKNAGPNQVTFGPIAGMDIGRTSHLLNLFLTRELGPDQDTNGLDFTYAWQSRWNLWAPLSPAIEIYGDTGTLGHSPRFSQQQLLIGPVAIGALQLYQLGLGTAGKIKYEIGWLFGATEASPQGTLRWRLELEIPF
jgi:hypothetical protein